jgi:hypothetical protein
VTEVDQSQTGRAYAAIIDAARAFTLADQGAPVVSVSWTDFVEPELTSAEFGIARMGPGFEGSIGFAPIKVDDEALAWSERYLTMSKALRPLIDLALGRLNLARRRRSAGDKAIDACICLEALLGDENPTELTYRLRLRAALLLGSTLPERTEIRNAVGRLYDLRSKIVHGRVRRVTDMASDYQDTTRGLEICTQVVRSMVQRKRRPDFTVWELTGKSED